MAHTTDLPGIQLANLAKRLKTLRKEQGYTNYEKFAFEKDISRGQYWRYEKGEDMKFTTLVRLVQAFDMTLEEFFSEGFEHKKTEWEISHSAIYSQDIKSFNYDCSL